MSTVVGILARAIAGLLMMLLPFAVWRFLQRQLSTSPQRGHVFLGAGTFILSQIIHIPLLVLILNPMVQSVWGSDLNNQTPLRVLMVVGIIYGAAAGVCEELSRLLVYWFFVTPTDRTWTTAIVLGTGHGGCEAFLLGFFCLYTLGYMMVLEHTDLSKLVPANMVDTLAKQIKEYWAVPWPLVLLAPPTERVTAMTFHVSASVLVLQVFRKSPGNDEVMSYASLLPVVRLCRSLWYLTAAIAFHTAIDALALVGALSKWNIFLLEAILFVLVIPPAACIIRYFYNQDGASALYTTHFAALDQMDQDDEAAALDNEEEDEGEVNNNNTAAGDRSTIANGAGNHEIKPIV